MKPNVVRRCRQIAVVLADLMRHPRDPAAMLRRAGEFAFPAFRKRLAAVLEK